MPKYNAPLRDMKFIMYELFNVEEKWAQWQDICPVDKDTVGAILEESAKLASRVIAPLNRRSDEEGCSISDGIVSTPQGYKEAYQQYSELGFIGLGGNPKYGGMGLPKVVGVQIDEMMSSASLSFILYPGLTSGATLAIDAHASETLKSFYLPRLYSGEWAATMCLTEPHAGTDLGIIKTKAIPEDDNSYTITGTKIFITGGEHDLTSNIIHLVLAKLPDAPGGTKGISLFLVPKININSDGSLANRNGVSCGSLEKKMGIKGSATCVMHFDHAKGYLIGAQHKGLAAMFTMMNYERLGVGIQGLGCGEMSYQNAVSYAKERLQGRSATGIKAHTEPADPILVHGDIRRMLLTMKSLTEAGRAFSTYVAMQLDIAKFSTNEEEQKRAEGKVALLTPVTKAFFTDAGLEVSLTGQQVFGGHGYIREWGQEQLVRDVRIAQIYEGTNGIQALDLLGRKIALNGGVFFREYITEIKQSVSSYGHIQHTKLLTKALDRLEGLTITLLDQAKDDSNVISSSCVDYLHAFAYVTYGWMWLLMADQAQKSLDITDKEATSYQAKLSTANYYFKRILPRVFSLADVAESGASALYALTDEQF